MLNNFKNSPGQSLIDVTVSQYGDMEAFFDLLVDNGINDINADIDGSQSFLIDSSKKVVSKFKTEIAAVQVIDNTKLIVADGQSLFDVTIQEYGDVEAFFDLLINNEIVDVNGFLKAGQELNINQNSVLNPFKTYFKKNKKRVNTHNEKEQIDSFLLTELGDFIVTNLEENLEING